MKNIILQEAILWVFISAIFFTGCGSAEAIKGYRYATTKDNLEKTVDKVIRNNPGIYRDSSHDYMFDTTLERAVYVTNSRGLDSAFYYNDRKHYVTITIKKGTSGIVYIFRYAGDEQYWKTSSSSEIFISEVHDEHGNKLSQGHNENGEFKSAKAKEFTDFFEAELVSKIDKALNMNHTDD